VRGGAAPNRAGADAGILDPPERRAVETGSPELAPAQEVVVSLSNASREPRAAAGRPRALAVGALAALLAAGAFVSAVWPLLRAAPPAPARPAAPAGPAELAPDWSLQSVRDRWYLEPSVAPAADVDDRAGGRDRWYLDRPTPPEAR
jgi:hypothetical protein